MCAAYNRRKELLFLGQQLGVARVQLQKLFNIFQLGLGVLDFTVYAFQSGLQLCSIAADFYGDTFDSACCQCGHLLTSKKYCLRLLAFSKEIGYTIGKGV